MLYSLSDRLFIRYNWPYEKEKSPPPPSVIIVVFFMFSAQTLSAFNDTQNTQNPPSPPAIHKAPEQNSNTDYFSVVRKDVNLR